MLKRWVTILLVTLALSARVCLGGEGVSVVVVDGVTYNDVRWGPVNQGKVVMFHNHGVAVVPLAKLPEEYARQLGYRPPAAAAEASAPAPAAESLPAMELSRPQTPAFASNPDPVPPQERAAFDAACAAQMVLNGALVDKSALMMLTGFYRAKAQVTGETRASEGLMVELANRKQPARPVPENLELRPGLWDGTGQEVFLRDYSPHIEPGMLLRVYAKEGDPIKGCRTFYVAQDLTYDLWKKLR